MKDKKEEKAQKNPSVCPRDPHQGGKIFQKSPVDFALFLIAQIWVTYHF